MFLSMSFLVPLHVTLSSLDSCYLFPFFFSFFLCSISPFMFYMPSGYIFFVSFLPKKPLLFMLHLDSQDSERRSDHRVRRESRSQGSHRKGGWQAVLVCYLRAGSFRRLAFRALESCKAPFLYNLGGGHDKERERRESCL